MILFRTQCPRAVARARRALRKWSIGLASEKAFPWNMGCSVKSFQGAPALADEKAAGPTSLGRGHLDMSLVRRLAIAAGILVLVTAAAALTFAY